MSVRFTVLASGSRGNASLVRLGGAGLLIDLGLGAREFAARLSAVGANWGQMAAALLTHTHGDHVSDPALSALTRHRVPLYCHEGHRSSLARFGAFAKLETLGLVRTYDDEPFLAPCGLQVEPIVAHHDGGPTFGFRIEGRASRRDRAAAIGYLADTGCWHPTTADSLADVDLLAIEFNHDVRMQRQSGRPYYLIARNLGDRGHLSNDQGANLVASVLDRSGRGAVKQVVLLHLSDQCNRPELALAAARGAIRGTGRRIGVYVAAQHEPTGELAVVPGRRTRRLDRTAVAFPWEEAG